MPYFAMNPCDALALCAEFTERMTTNADGGNWYALLDTAFSHNRNPLKKMDATCWPIYHSGRLQTLQPVSPVLLELAAEPDTLKNQLGRLLRYCSGYPMLGFINSTQPAAFLRENWQNLLIAEAEEGDAWLLRFADTRVLPALSQQTAIWNRLAAGLNAWWIIGRDGLPVSLPMPDAPIFDDTPLRISDDCFFALLNAGEADAMAEYMGTHFSELLTRRSGAENHRLLVQTVNLCAECGITETAGQNAVGVAVLLTDGKLLAQPAFHDLLKNKEEWQAQGIEDALGEFMESKGL